MRSQMIGLGLAIATALGCGSGSTAGTGASADKQIRIAVIPKGATHEFWKSIHEGADKAAAEHGGVEIIWKGPQLENDRESQIKTVEDFVTQGVSGIVLAPLDDKALIPSIKQAVKSDIPVVIIDSGVDTDQYVSFVSTDNEKGGAMAGEEMVKLLGGKGRLVVLRYQEGSASTMAREKGFLDVMAKNPGINVLSQEQFAGPTVETAQKAAENLLSRFKRADGALDLAGIYCPNESSTFGMLRVLQDNKWAGKVKFVGFDSSEKLLSGMKDGEIDALVVQNPRKMGYLGVKTMLDSLEKKPVERRIDTGAVLVTKANISEPDVVELLAPPKG